MADSITTITHLINSSPGQLAAGAVLAGIVWKFFERVESVLNENTKLEIAVWLLGVKVGQKVEPWPETFAKVFDRVFGTKHLSWKCFWRSCIASYCAVAVCWLALLGWEGGLLRWLLRFDRFVLMILFGGTIGNLLPDYASLLETRWLLRAIRNSKSTAIILCVLLLDAVTTAVIGVIGGSLVDFVFNFGLAWRHGDRMDLANYFLTVKVAMLSPWGLVDATMVVWVAAAFFTSIWLWLYAGSGFLLKAARRFDIGFEWFNRKFDIEKKPLQSIGLVAGALVAVVYWAAVIVSRVVE
jgi:hypothetical protein